jgi:hypothetical protein
MRFLPSLLGATVALLASGCSHDASATPNAPAAPKAPSPKAASYALTYFTMPG